jgi:hypothetical protein
MAEFLILRKKKQLSIVFWENLVEKTRNFCLCLVKSPRELNVLISPSSFADPSLPLHSVQSFGSGQALILLPSPKKGLLRLRLAMTLGVEGEEEDRE